MTYNPNKNLYDDMEEYINRPKIPQNPPVSANGRELHTTEYVPKNIIEFAKHMDARSRAAGIRYLAYGMAIIGLISIYTDFVVDLSAKTLVYMFIHAAVLIVFAVLMKRTYSKNVALVFSVYTAVCTIIMIASYSYISDISLTYSAVVFAYVPICIQVSLNIVLWASLTEYYNAWEVYEQTGTVPQKKQSFKEKMQHLDRWINDRT